METIELKHTSAFKLTNEVLFEILPYSDSYEINKRYNLFVPASTKKFPHRIETFTLVHQEEKTIEQICPRLLMLDSDATPYQAKKNFIRIYRDYEKNKKAFLFKSLILLTFIKSKS